MTDIGQDRDVVAAQIDRRPRAPVDVVARCHLDLPVVIEVPPRLDDGTPFPTLYWLTCPLAVRRIGRVEAAGGVRGAEQRAAADPDLARRHDAAMARYAAQRELRIDPTSMGPRPRGGVGGASAGVKCLHAHYADHAAGNDNPTGEWVAPDVEPLDCTEPCVAQIAGTVMRNPQWREPRRVPSTEGAEPPTSSRRSRPPLCPPGGSAAPGSGRARR
jgi:hypothetical protein